MRKISTVFLFCLSSIAFAEPGTGLQNPLQKELTGKTCQFWEDSQHIPHFKAEEENVGFACLGYLHGRDRSWQMDLMRRVGEGKLAELKGTDGIRSDFIMRLLDLKGRAAKMFKELDPAHQNFLWSYAYGVNQGFNEAQKKGVYEFQDLGLRPEPWTPEDSLLMVYLQSLDQTRRSFELQLTEKEWMKKYPKDAAQLFRFDSLPWDTKILKPGEYPTRSDSLAHPPNSVPLNGSANEASQKKWLQEFREFVSVIPDSSIGSNNWVLNSSRTEKGFAILANDPHLQITYPSFWYWVHWNTNEIDSMGASFPGLPLIAIGTNRHVSWGVTNSYLPVARLSMVSESELKDSKENRTWIWFKLWKFKLPYFFKTLRRTAGGLPILPLSDSYGKAVVLRWTGFDFGPKDLVGLFDLMKARNVKETDQALAQVGVPSWNFVFADDHGQVGYRAIGRIPRFEKEPPFGVPTEKLAEVENSKAFSHPLSADEVPHVLNPSRGFVATANNQQWPQDSQWSSGHAQAAPFRAFRIEELIQQKPRHDLASVQKIQCDISATDARFILPELLKTLDESADSKAVALLKGWNFETGPTCRACGIYRRWIEIANSELDLTAGALYQLLKNPGTTPVQETSKKAFAKAVAELKAIHPDFPSWGVIHGAAFHDLAGLEFREAKYLATPGDAHTVNVAESNWNGQYYDQIAGASLRMIVEMTSPPTLYSILPGSNRDERNIPLEGSDFQDWVQCKLQKREFPLNWAKVRAQRWVLD